MFAQHLSNKETATTSQPPGKINHRPQTWAHQQQIQRSRNSPGRRCCHTDARANLRVRLEITPQPPEPTTIEGDCAGPSISCTPCLRYRADIQTTPQKTKISTTLSPQMAAQQLHPGLCKNTVNLLTGPLNQAMSLTWGRWSLKTPAEKPISPKFCKTQ